LIRTATLTKGYLAEGHDGLRYVCRQTMVHLTLRAPLLARYLNLNRRLPENSVEFIARTMLHHRPVCPTLGGETRRSGLRRYQQPERGPISTTILNSIHFMGPVPSQLPAGSTNRTRLYMHVCGAPHVLDPCGRRETCAAARTEEPNLRGSGPFGMGRLSHGLVQCRADQERPTARPLVGQLAVRLCITSIA
jgi:hypothetical protein